MVDIHVFETGNAGLVEMGDRDGKAGPRGEVQGDDAALHELIRAVHILDGAHVLGVTTEDFAGEIEK